MRRILSSRMTLLAGLALVIVLLPLVFPSTYYLRVAALCGFRPSRRWA